MSGGGDWSSDRLIPDLIRSYKSNKKRLKLGASILLDHGNMF